MEAVGAVTTPSVTATDGDTSVVVPPRSKSFNDKDNFPPRRRSSMDIITWYQQKESVSAKADERKRRRSQVAANRVQVIEAELQAVQQVLEKKEQRLEREKKIKLEAVERR